MQINVAVTDANNIVCEVVPPQTQIITIDRGVAGNGIVSIVPVTISTFQYLRITYTNGTVQDVGPLTSTAYTATSPITIVGNTISLATVPIASGGTDATTAAGAIQNLLPSYTGNANKRLGLNSTATALEWVLDGGGTVTSIAASGGTTGLTFSGSPITTSGTLTLGGTLAIANGGTGATTAADALTNLGAIGAITSTDGSVTITSTGTSRDLSVAVAAATTNVIAQVRNTTGATLTKGTVVYISGATGQISTVSKALATSDATSAQTLGMMTADLANNSNGNVTIIGLITNIDTSAYSNGQQLYLSGTTAGAVTATKPYAPIHLVYVAVVEYSHPTQGKLFVKVQNGYELDEIHDVSAQTPSNGQTLVYNSSNSLWENNTVSLAIGVNGTLPIANGGTGQTTANAAFNALAPSQTGNSGKYLTTDGSNTSWATNPLGTVTSVAATVPSFLSISGSPITTSGTLAFGLSGTALPTTSGGTGLTSFTSGGVVYASSTSALTTGSALNYATGTGVGNLLEVTGGSNNINGQLNIQGTDGTNTSFVSLLSGLEPTNLPSLFFSNGLRFAIATNKAASGYSEQMRLNSTGLGVGTSSPVEKVQSSKGVAATGANQSVGSLNGFVADYSSGASRIFASRNGVASSTLELWTTDSGGAANKNATLDASGNLGLGVTPSAWAVYKAYQVGWGALASYSDADTAVFSNTYFDGGTWRYVGNGTASQYRQLSGAHSWQTAASGLAGNAISFTQSMTLNTSGNLGIGTTSPIVKLQVYDAGNTFSGSFGSVGGAQIVAIGNSAGIATIQGFSNSSFAAYSDLALQSGGGNVGIGTSSPASKLTVSRGGSAGLVSNFTDGVAQGLALTTGTGYFGFYNPNYGAITFRDGGNASELMRLDTSGNLGLGVVPSAWDGALKAIQVNTQGVFASETSAVHVMTNVYYNSGYKYIGTGYATDYYQYNGLHAWRTASSGTVGNAISWTQAMTLDASGNLGVGTTSPSYRFDVRGVPGNSAYTQINISGTGSARNLIYGDDSGNLLLSADATNVGSGSYMGFSTDGAERARITSSGNFGVGTSSPSTKIEANQLDGSGTRTNPVDVMTISASAPSSAYAYNGFGAGLLFKAANYLSATALTAARIRSSLNDNSFSSLGSSLAFDVTATRGGSLYQAMELNYAGNLGLRFVPSDWRNDFKALQIGPAISLASYNDSNLDLGSNWFYSSASGDYRIAAGYATLYQQDTGRHIWNIAGSGAAGSAISFTQAMTLDAGGALLVGFSSITSTGANGVTSGGLAISGGQTNGGASVADFYNSNGTTGSDSSPPVTIRKAVGTTTSSARFVQFYASGSGTAMGGIVGNGSANVQFAALSDAREKTNVQPMVGSLAKISALKPVEFDWIKSGEHINSGFIAQDVEEIFPEFVVANMSDDGQQERKGLTGGMTSGIIPHLVKAIQEQQAIIESLKARLDAANL